MKVLENYVSPQLKKLHSGKVRESFRITIDRRLIVVTDRLSSFDKVLKSAIPYKGAVLNTISNYWFEKTKDIVPNHLIEQIHPNINLVKEANPIRIEMIVRGYLTGSMWRKYQQGKREFCGIKVKDGLQKNHKFEEPLVTPTTKEKIDREITPERIIDEGWASAEEYENMRQISLKLFNFGEKYLQEKGIILVDTKYEFGKIGEKMILIDEIHTPDSSRFWYKKDYNSHPLKVKQIDKEFVRQWLLEHKEKESIPEQLPDEIISETTQRYLSICKIITGKDLKQSIKWDLAQHIVSKLVMNSLIQPGYVVIIMGSPKDLSHAEKIEKLLKKYKIKILKRIVSAHKNGEHIRDMAVEFNNAFEPGVAIAIAGRSNGLGGALAANLSIPVVNCPPFNGKVDMMVNINSSLMMPSNTPAATIIDPKNAAAFAIRCLNIPSFREKVNNKIQLIKDNLQEENEKLMKED